MQPFSLPWQKFCLWNIGPLPGVFRVYVSCFLFHGLGLLWVTVEGISFEITSHSHGGFCWPFCLRAHSHVPFPPLPRTHSQLPTVITAYVDAGVEGDSLSCLSCYCRRKNIQNHPTLLYWYSSSFFCCKSLKAWVHSGIRILMRERNCLGTCCWMGTFVQLCKWRFLSSFPFFPFFF